MRRFTIFAVAMMFSLALADSAEAGKKKKDKGGEEAATTEEAAPAEAGADAAAAEEPKIEVTGVADIDNVFGPAGEILTNVITARKAIDSLGTNLTTALGLPAGTPFKDALADLKTKAEGKVQLAMDEGGMPSLKAGDAVPANVQQAIDAVNGGMKDVMSAATALAEVPAKAMEVVNAAKSINPANLTGVTPTKIPKITKQLGTNVKLVSTLPEEAKTLLNSVTDLKNDLTSSFGG